MRGLKDGFKFFDVSQILVGLPRRMKIQINENFQGCFETLTSRAWEEEAEKEMEK